MSTIAGCPMPSPSLLSGDGSPACWLMHSIAPLKLVSFTGYKFATPAGLARLNGRIIWNWEICRGKLHQSIFACCNGVLDNRVWRHAHIEQIKVESLQSSIAPPSSMPKTCTLTFSIEGTAPGISLTRPNAKIGQPCSRPSGRESCQCSSM